MCFSETQSYINAALLAGTGIYASPNYKLSITAIYFSIKELLQGLLYKYQGNKSMLKLLGIGSWIHIAFQPLFLNIFYSHFVPNFKFWNIVFILCIILGIIISMELDALDIQNDPDCTSDNPNDDFCSKETGGYMGKYHIGYKFKTDKRWEPINMWHYWLFLGFGIVLFTKGYPLGISFLIFVFSIYSIYNYLNDIQGIPGTVQEYSGEKAAIWCFLTVGFVPLILYEKKIRKLLI